MAIDIHRVWRLKCNTTDEDFGPSFRSEAEAIAFMRKLGKDPRSVTDDELETALAVFRAMPLYTTRAECCFGAGDDRHDPYCAECVPRCAECGDAMPDREPSSLILCDDEDCVAERVRESRVG